MTATQVLTSATAEYLRRYQPFDRMEPEALDFLCERVKLAYYGKDSKIVSPESGEVRTFYIIQRGKVAVRNAGGDSTQSGELTFGPGESFPIGSLTARRPSTNLYLALGDVFCYELAAEDFFSLMQTSPVFNLFCTRYIASMLTQSRQQLQVQFAQQASEQQTMSSPLAMILKHKPVTTAAETSIEQALQTMADRSIGSIVVVDADNKPEGIFTKSDVLKRVALPQLSLDTPIVSVMSDRLHTLPSSASIYEAALSMAMNGIRHLLVTDEAGGLTGIVSERDLFALQRIGLAQLRQLIANADNLEILCRAIVDVRQLAVNMLAQGVGAEQLTRFISALNDAITYRVIELNLKNHDLYGIQWAWLAFGSEGREEQSFISDQDNGIVYICPDLIAREPLELRFLEFAKDVNRDLDRCGFPLCKGNIMAGNPQWMLTLEEWEEQFAQWILNPEPQALLNVSIFFDFRAVYGEKSLADRLRLSVMRHARSSPIFLRMMAKNALDIAPPLGRIRDFVTDLIPAHPGKIDLKTYGARLFVDAARIFALAEGVQQINSVQRLLAVAAKFGRGAENVEAMVDGLNFIQLLRLRHQHFEMEHGRSGDNLIDPDELNDLNRRILKESFRQARILQQRLKVDYQL